MAFLLPETLRFRDRDAFLQADLLQVLFFTSSSLNGLMTASIFFIAFPPPVALPTHGGEDLPWFRLAGSMPTPGGQGNPLRIRCLVFAQCLHRKAT